MTQAASEPNLPTLATMTYAVDGGIARVTLNRPERLNAITMETMADFEALLDRVEGRTDIAALVFRGTGKGFCVGLDLGLLNAAFADIFHFERILKRFNAILHRIERLPFPTVAAVNGYTRAGGFELCLVCDFIVIADEAKIGDAHTSAAVMPGGGSTQRLPRRVGEPRAKEIIWSARWLSAAEAVAYGLAIRSAPLKDLDAAVDTLLASFTDKPTACLAAVKAAMLAGRGLDIRHAVDVEIAQFISYTGSQPYAREGYQAFLEKRPPSWQARAPTA
ncbi:MAG: enoyl-CoA hydratase/isomerase family protein [Rhodospirillaceae bacterium]|nr:enoyl-CoA hydratase/isomerase family protein [Rhodospirillaceae bacterium]